LSKEKIRKGGVKMKKVSLILITACLMIIWVIPAFGEFHCLIKNKKLAREIGLTDEQRENIKELMTSTKKKMIDIRADIEILEIDLRNELDEEKPDEGKAISLIKEIMKKKTDAQILKVKNLITVKKQLTPEQFEKYEEFKMEHHKRQEKKHHRKKENKHDGQGDNKHRKP
jgi:Spy/CpxP family protein refolding chaperone